MSTEIDYINYVVIGIGINTNIEQFPEELKQTATSLRIEAGHSIRRSPLIAAIMRWFEKAYAEFMKTEDLSGIQKAYNELLVNCGREVRVLEPKGEWQAEALGINNGGELLVRKADGSETAVYAGEVSVRGIYGYV
jgi:BirA family biotin operon repressor/biotin-[acetyl-CoA-carboxylase] ligase